MATNTIERHTFAIDSEGFFTDSSQWNEELCTVLADLIGIEEMTPKHWEAIRFMRTDAAQTGMTPTLRRISSVGGFDVRELFALFPGKPAKKMSYLAGLPKPIGCV